MEEVWNDQDSSWSQKGPKPNSRSTRASVLCTDGWTWQKDEVCGEEVGWIHRTLRTWGQRFCLMRLNETLWTELQTLYLVNIRTSSSSPANILLQWGQHQALGGLLQQEEGHGQKGECSQIQRRKPPPEFMKPETVDVVRGFQGWGLLWNQNKL